MGIHAVLGAGSQHGIFTFSEYGVYATQLGRTREARGSKAHHTLAFPDKE